MENLIKFVSFVVILAVIVLIFGVPTYFLWNWLAPILFGFSQITYGQAIGLNLLTNVLFGRSNYGKFNKK